jgi:YVTN family beta-propeller protein
MPAGSGPDALVYDRAHQRLLVFNTRSEDISVIDARSGTALATVAIGGEPESAVLGSDGLVYFNVENTDEMVVFDPSAMRVVRRHALRPCSRPTAMAIGASGKVYTVCHNDMLVAVAGEGRVLGTVPFGRSSDSVATLGDLAYSAAGADGTLRIVGSAGGGAAAIGTLSQVTTAYGSRTVAADPATRQLYLPAARFSPEEGGQRRQALPDSLSVWVLQPR